MLRFLTIFVAAVLLSGGPALANDDHTLTPYSRGGDAAKGRVVFKQCRACHSLTDNGAKRTGPHLFKIFGRTTGGDKSYKYYSSALQDAELVWTEERLNRFLEDPNAYIRGVQATMRVRKVRDQQDRADLLAFLRQATEPEAR